MSFNKRIATFAVKKTIRSSHRFDSRFCKPQENKLSKVTHSSMSISCSTDQTVQENMKIIKSIFPECVSVFDWLPDVNKPVQMKVYSRFADFHVLHLWKCIMQHKRIYALSHRKLVSTNKPVAFRSVHTGIEPPFLLKIYYAITACMTRGFTSRKYWLKEKW